MSRLACFFGAHSYSPKDVEVYFIGEENGIWKYRAIQKCCCCGKESESVFSIPYPFPEERRTDEVGRDA